MIVGKMTRACPLKPAPSSDDVSLSNVKSAVAVLTFSPTINHRLQTILIFFIHHVHQRRVDPSTSFDRVQAGDDQVELQVVRFVVVLDLAMVARGSTIRRESASCQSSRAARSMDSRSDLDSRHTTHHEISSHQRLALADISFTKEELTVQVGDVDRVHVDDVNVTEAHWRM